MQLNERLTQVSQYIRGDVLADIGSDHAYLPIYALEHGKISSAIAGEVAQGPLASAKKSIQQHGYADKIEARLGDGLAVISENERVDVITICGMGGPLIGKILSEGAEKLSPHTRIVLQSNIQTIAARQVLQQLQYKIIAEDIMSENGHIYEIVVAEPGASSLSENELKFGPFLLKERSALFIEKWQREYDALVHITNQLDETKHAARLHEIKLEMDRIAEVIS